MFDHYLDRCWRSSRSWRQESLSPTSQFSAGAPHSSSEDIPRQESYCQGHCGMPATTRKAGPQTDSTKLLSALGLNSVT